MGRSLVELLESDVVVPPDTYSGGNDAVWLDLDAWNGGVVLDGNFTVAELKAIVARRERGGK